MDDLALLIDLHRDGPRQGPGSDDATRLALALSGLRQRRGLTIADVGCGTGASTRVLAQELDARISAVDLVPEFLLDLRSKAGGAPSPGRIDPVCASMDALPFADERFDAIWSEGAIYRMGFANGVTAWRRLLRPGGILAVSELTWLTAHRPEEIDAHWRAAYPEVATASAKLAVLETAGYAPLGCFVLPASCWLDGYYRPLQARFAGFLARHAADEAARRIVAEEMHEIELYERYREHVGYVFYVARRSDSVRALAAARTELGTKPAGP
jgi:SAM-dependent methyltransferase